MVVLGKAFAAFAVTASSLALVSSPAAADGYVPCTDAQVQILSGSSTLIGGATMSLKTNATSGGRELAGTITLSAESGLLKTPVPRGFDKLPSSKHTKSGIATFKIKTSVVTTRQTFRILAHFVPDDRCTASASAPVVNDSGATNASFIMVPTSSVAAAGPYRTADAHANITLLPRGSDASGNDSSGFLPSTGGVNSIYLILGGLFLVGGVATVVVGRKRAKHVV